MDLNPILLEEKVYRNLNDTEQFWIKKVLEKEFKGRQYLLRQVLSAKVHVEYGYDFISLKLRIEETEKYPYAVRVPVEMRAFQKESAPIVFLLHVVNGVINELELVTADSSKIDMEMIKLNKIEYVINEAVQ